MDGMNDEPMTNKKKRSDFAMMTTRHGTAGPPMIPTRE
jgi:hypothetical protein